ncbi:MAG: type 4a pilus biogenesis protein PilO [Deltaproteobacteria bacterium]|nr:type 4a pilus biogenesis protein PilO [Deltaproteobacteria bacterium]
MATEQQMNISQVLEQMARLPKNVRALILVGAAGAVLCIYGFTLYGGISKKAVALQGQLTQVQTKIVESRAVASNLKSFKGKQQELRAELEIALRRLPNQRQLPVLLTNMSSLAKKSGLEIRSFKPAAEVNRGFYAEVPISIEFLGRYHEAGIFFDRLSRLSRIINITELKMSLADRKALVPVLKVEGTATTFRFVDVAPDAQGGV